MEHDNSTSSRCLQQAGSAPYLFPEVAAEIREERQAAARESAQRVRQEKLRAKQWLKGRKLTWLIDYLTDRGPRTEHMAGLDAIEAGGDCNVILDLWALWRVGKLWREYQGVHFGSGEKEYRYGIRGVHEQNDKDEGLRTPASDHTTKPL